MKTAVTLMTLCLTFVSELKGRLPEGDLNRFPISIKGKYGFINTSGAVVIEPRFDATQEFAEGLCAVRIDGRYGFINTQGDLSIPAIYDYATEFDKGLAHVTLEGKPLFITREGKVKFDHPFKWMTPFHGSLAYVESKTGKRGMIDKNGKLVVDTAYQSIESFTNGLAVVTGLSHKKGQDRKTQVGVIDSTGNMVVPYGRFEGINAFSEGYSHVTWIEKRPKDTFVHGLINTSGEVVYSLSEADDRWIDGGVHDGIVRICLPIKKRNKKKSNWSSDNSYDAYVTPTGTTIYANPKATSGKDFSEGFAFYESKGDHFTMINRRGQVVVNSGFTAIAGDGFQEGKAFVKTGAGWGVIDTLGKFVVAPKFEGIHEASKPNDIIFFEKRSIDSTKQVTTFDSQEEIYYGVADASGNIIIQPILQYFNTAGFVNGLLKAWTDGRVTYFNTSGAIVWQEKPDEEVEPYTLNIDYMNRAYFYANYNYTGHGNSPSRAEPEKITMLNSFPSAALSVTVMADRPIELKNSLKAFVVFVANSTGDSVAFNAQDSRLYMKTQALDPKGQWRDIEYLPNSWCGNSYHQVVLPENHYWTFVTPVCEGCYYTKLRIELTYIDPSKVKGSNAKRRFGTVEGELVLYSNEYDGSINPAQFWRRPEYHPGGIMDPYNE